jgi:DNA polymerase-1
VAHNHPGAPEQLPLDAVLATLKPWFEDERAQKVGHNIKYESHALANNGVTVRGWAHDTLLQSYVLEAHRRHDLENLADRHLNRKGLTYEEVCGKGANQIAYSQLDTQRATEYAAGNCEMTLQLHQTLGQDFLTHLHNARTFKYSPGQHPFVK